MKYAAFLSIIAMVALAGTPVSAAGRDFDTIDNAPEEKERGRQAYDVVSDTPNGDKVMRILKKKLPGWY